MMVISIKTLSLCLIFFHLLARKPNLEEKKSIYSSKFFHNLHLSESSFTCPGLRASGLVRRLHLITYLYLLPSGMMFGTISWTNKFGALFNLKDYDDSKMLYIVRIMFSCFPIHLGIKVMNLFQFFQKGEIIYVRV